MLGDLEADAGTVKWAENASVGYFAQDHSADFSENMSLFEWITQWQPPGTDEQLLRATLGRMLFSRDESEKSVQVVSGGEQGRLLFGKLASGGHIHIDVAPEGESLTLTAEKGEAPVVAARDEE